MTFHHQKDYMTDTKKILVDTGYAALNRAYTRTFQPLLQNHAPQLLPPEPDSVAVPADAMAMENPPRFFRIIKNIQKLKSKQWGMFNLEDSISEIRQGVLDSHKFYIDKSVLLSEFNRNVDRLEMFTDYFRPPYPIMLISIPCDLSYLLIEKPDGFNVYMVNPDEMSVTPCVLVFTRAPDGNLVVSTLPSEEHFKKNIATANAVEVTKEDHEQSMIDILKLVGPVFMALLLINTSNIHKPRVNPSKKELAGVPKVMEPKYSFRVIDLLRTVPENSTVGEMVRIMSDPVRRAQARASFVRGHFKRLASGLHWWNPFLRNLRNAQITGVVDKAYNVK